MRTLRTTPIRALKAVAAMLLAATVLATSALPALARDSYVKDGAGLFSDATISSLNQQIGDFSSQTGKEVVVDTVPSLNGQTVQDAAERAFAQLQVNGVLIFMAKAERQDLVLGDRASRAFFPPGTFQSIHDAMRGYFRQGDFDGGIKTGVNLVLAQYRSHERATSGGATRTYPVSRPVPSSAAQTGGYHMSFFWLLIILLAGFLIIRALFRAMAGPRMMPPGYGPGQGYGPGAGPGYGPGYGYGGGGGGSFFSGLLGGLGGAFLGNELFGNRGGGGGTSVQDPNAAGIAGGTGGVDASGWQSDAGQADMSNAGGGDWGGGGGFDAGGGGDFGGGGFDAGGGGGDGGGW